VEGLVLLMFIVVQEYQQMVAQKTVHVLLVVVPLPVVNTSFVQ
jgi:hypothetical protein